MVLMPEAPSARRKDSPSLSPPPTSRSGGSNKVTSLSEFQLGPNILPSRVPHASNKIRAPVAPLCQSAPVTPRRGLVLAQSSLHDGTDITATEELTLRLGAPSDRRGIQDRALYVQVLKKLLGDEMRDLLRTELVAVLRCQDSGARQVPRSPAEPVDEQEEQKEPEGGCHAVAVSEEIHHSRFFDEGLASSLTRAIESDDRDVSLHFDRHRSLNIIAPVGGGHTSVGRCFLALDRAVQKLGNVEAPNEIPCLKVILESHAWNTLVCLVIIVNCCYMLVASDWRIKNPGHGQSDLSDDANVFIFVCESIFLAFYMLEFGLKIANYGRYLFVNSHWKLNILDLILVLGNLCSFGLALLTDVNSIIQNLTWLRVLRLIGLLKAARVLRVAMAFGTLRAILLSLTSSLEQLFWSSIMLLTVLFMFALFFVSRLATFLETEGQFLDTTLKKEMLEAFGSVGSAIITLFMATTGGNDWAYYYNLWQATGKENQALFVFFVAFINIALLNIILGVFVDRVMKNLRPDLGQLAAEHAHCEAQKLSDLRNLCSEADVNKDGTMSAREWSRLLRQGELATYLDMLGFRSQDLQDFFWCLSRKHPRGDVRVDEFVSGCMRLKGDASRFNMQALLCEMKDMKTRLLQGHVDLQELVSNMKSPRVPWMP